MKTKAGTVIPPERRSPRLAKVTPKAIPTSIDLTERSTESVEEVFPEKVPEVDHSVEVIKLAKIREILLNGLEGQDVTLNKLANILFEFIVSQSECILPLLLSGTSGTGKTSTIERLLKVFGIEESQKVYQDMSEITTQGEISKLLGSAPSYTGYGDKCFVDKLLLAIGDNGLKTKKITTTTTKKKSTKFTITPDKTKPPSFVLVHFEEVDKGHPDALTILINFLETGRLTSGNRREFVLPKETKMIVVMTANYGKDDLTGLSYLTDFYKARSVIIESMQMSGIEKPMIGRFPHILPYFPLEKKVTEKIASQSISSLFELVEFQYRDYFTKFSFLSESFTELERALSIYAKQADPELGMRSLKAVLKELKRELCCETMLYITQYLSKEKLPLKESPVLEVLSLSSITDYDSLLERCEPNTTTYHLIKEAQESSAVVELVLVIVTYKDRIMTSLVIQSEKIVTETALIIVKDRKYCDMCGHYCQHMTRVRSPEMFQTKIRMIFKNYCNLCISLQRQQQQLMYQ